MNWEDKYHKDNEEYGSYKARMPKEDRSYYCPYDRNAGSGDIVPCLYPGAGIPTIPRLPVCPPAQKGEFYGVTIDRLKQMENEAVAVEDYERAEEIVKEIKRRNN